MAAHFSLQEGEARPRPSRVYQVEPIALRQQVRRNPKRFPSDFLFELDEEEVEALLSQNVIPSRRNSWWIAATGLY